MIRIIGHLPRRLVLIALVTVSAIALAIAALTVARATPISRRRAIEIATLACRVPHLVLVGEPRGVRAQLVAVGGTRVWRVELDGQLQLVGGPATASAPTGQSVTATPLQAFEGTCTAMINAKTGEWNGTTGQPMATPP